MALGVLVGYLVAAGATGSGAARPEAGATPVKVASRPATRGEVAAAGVSKITLLRGQTVKTRISSHAIMTNKNSGDFVGLTCPKGYTAISGGAVTGFINLLVSHSAPIKPTGRQRYTPRTFRLSSSTARWHLQRSWPLTSRDRHWRSRLFGCSRQP